MAKTFYPKDYKGDMGRCYRAAIRWRNRTMKEVANIRPPVNRGSDYLIKRYFTFLRSNNTSGVNGVYSRVCKQKGGTYSYIWVACWSEDGEGERIQRKKSWAYDPHDPEDKKRKFRIAVRHRKKMERQHYIGGMKSSRPSAA